MPSCPPFPSHPITFTSINNQQSQLNTTTTTKEKKKKKMVCSKCQKKLKSTELATPGVKRKSEMYYGSPATSSSSGAGAGASKPTLGNTGIGKSKLLTSKAKNPYAAYASSCESCKTKTEQGKKFCQRCAYQKNACPMCGKSLAAKSSKDQPIVQGQKFNLK